MPVFESSNPSSANLQKPSEHLGGDGKNKGAGSTALMKIGVHGEMILIAVTDWGTILVRENVGAGKVKRLGLMSTHCCGRLIDGRVNECK